MTVFRTSRFARSLLVLALTVSSTALLLGGVAQADGHEKDAARLKYRQSLMSIIGTNMGAIGDILKNQLTLPGAITNHAGQMAESAALIAGAFEHEITAGPTDAKPEIWQDWPKFEKAIADYQEAALNLQKTAASGDKAGVGPAVKALGKSCSGCHKPFRKPKEESYKNK